MNAITEVQGKAIAVRGNDIDTDRIIPARFMKVVTFDGLGEYAFTDDRAQMKERGEVHPFDVPANQGGHILVVNKNFGCGSSREHAPQALKRWGIDGLIGESFAEIFAGNCTSLGMPAVTAPEATVQAIQSWLDVNPGGNLHIDLNASVVRAADGTEWRVEMPSGVHQRLVTGQWDALGQLLDNMEKVESTIQDVPYLNGRWS